MSSDVTWLSLPAIEDNGREATIKILGLKRSCLDTFSLDPTFPPGEINPVYTT